MKNGILLIGDHQKDIESRAKSSGLGFMVSDEYDLPFQKTLILESGTRVPWDLLPSAWNFLNRWDMATPLWKYGKTARDIGTKEEREITRELTLDLRVLVYSHELLFVRKNKTGAAFLESWLGEIARGPEKRLAFLRALFLIKPKLCALPVSWLAEILKGSKQAVYRNPRIRRGGGVLVRVDIGNGRIVKCHPGDEERIRAFHEQAKTRKR